MSLNTNPTVVTSQEFDRWWRDWGQFLCPADVSTGADLERLRHFANSMFNDRFGSVEEKISDLESAVETAKQDAKAQMENFKEDISKALNSPSPLETIKRLLK